MRPVYFTDAGYVDTPTYDRARSTADNRIDGPALIEEYASTTVVHPGRCAHGRRFGNLVIEIGEADDGHACSIERDGAADRSRPIR